MKGLHGFSKHERIRKNLDYRRAVKQGASYGDGIFVLAISKNRIGRHRLGVSIGSLKVRLPSRRNRIKRLAREFFRLNKEKIKNGPYDIVIMVKAAPSEKLGYRAVEAKLTALLKKANAL